MFVSLALQTNPVVRVVDLSGNELSHFPVEPLVLSPHNALEALEKVDILDNSVRNIPKAYHSNIAPLLRRTRGDATSLNQVHVVLVGDGGQGKSTTLHRVFFPHANVKLPLGRQCVCSCLHAVVDCAVHVLQILTRGSPNTCGGGLSDSTLTQRPASSLKPLE